MRHYPSSVEELKKGIMKDLEEIRREIDSFSPYKDVEGLSYEEQNLKDFIEDLDCIEKLEQDEYMYGCK